MKFPGFSRPATGVAVPVSALRSGKSFGIGEFPDLVPLGAWCRDAGLDVIQILPVNDTGFQPSPYGARSAYALHPVYLRLEDLPELSGREKGIRELKGELEKTRAVLESHRRVRFRAVLEAKLGYLRRVYDLSVGRIAEDESLGDWVAGNPWVTSYALFSRLKDLNRDVSWVQWETLRRPTEGDIRRAWENPEEKKDLLFYAWVQKRLEEQFRKAAEELDGMGIFLKGDLPILMSEDSADVWAHPELFRRDLRAGAPPDMFSETGQNWGFPIYDWEALGKRNYAWWKERLRRADLFYHAYRIDHVLGFFRIWAIPDRETSGILGFFKPACPLDRKDLVAKGFDDGRIRWMTRPHVAGGDIRRVFGNEADRVRDELFQRIGNEDLFLFRPEVSESLLDGLSHPEGRKADLLRWYRDRALIESEDGTFSPAWYREGSKAYASLQDQERRGLEDLVSRYFRDSEARWSGEGEALLRFMKESTVMLPCAEDLGVVPDCVPVVLERLGILGLRIPRWTRKYKEPGEPFVPPKEYPVLSVCAASVHDTSTLREWWEREADREGFWRALGLTGAPPGKFTPAVGAKVFSGLLASSSILVMFQLQDFLALSSDFRVSDPSEERINVPGTVADTNWSYRTPFRTEDLLAHESLKKTIRDLVHPRGSRRG